MTGPFPKLKFSLAIILAVLSLFWPVLLHPFHILHPTFSPFSDVMVIHWPKAWLMAQSWQAGHGLPHWTPLILSGMPLAANQLAMLFYPPAWLFLILPIEPVFNLLFIFHLLLGGFGVYALLRRAHGLSSGAALSGSLAFALNGKWLAHVAGGHVSMVGAIGWMPWALFGVMMLLQKGEQRAREQRLKEVELEKDGTSTPLNPPYKGGGWEGVETPRTASFGIILTAIALAMQILTHTLLLIYAVYLIMAAVAWHVIFVKTENRWAEIKRIFWPLLAVPLLAGLLGAVQLLPLLELAQFSNRALSLSEAAEFSMSPIQLFIGLFLPSAQGGHELVIYLGLAPLLLAPFGLSRKNRWGWFYGLLLIFTILFALGPGTPIHRLFYHLVPGFGWVRTPPRMFFVGALSVAALVGFAVDNLAQGRWSPAATRWLMRTAVALGTLALLLGLGLAFGFGQTTRAAFALAIFVPLGLILIVLRVQQRLSTALATGLLGLILLLDLASFDISMMRFVPPEAAFGPGRPAAQYLAKQLPAVGTEEGSPENAALFRVYSPSYSLPMQTAAAARLHLADGVEPVHLEGYDQYMARAGGYGDASFSVTIPNFGEAPLESALSQTQPNLKLLGLLNVTYLASAFPMEWTGLHLETRTEEAFIYRNKQALPRAWIAHRGLPAEQDWLTQLENLSNPANEVVIESNERTAERPRRDATRQGEGQPTASAGDRVEITFYSADLIELVTEIEEPGWLVLSEIWYPGWQATVNDAPRPVERVNGLLRGIYLDQAGRYQISMAYRPQSVMWGGWVSGVTAALLVGGGLFWMGKRFRSS